MPVATETIWTIEIELLLVGKSHFPPLDGPGDVLDGKPHPMVFVLLGEGRFAGHFLPFELRVGGQNSLDGPDSRNDPNPTLNMPGGHLSAAGKGDNSATIVFGN